MKLKMRDVGYCIRRRDTRETCRDVERDEKEITKISKEHGKEIKEFNKALRYKDKEYREGVINKGIEKN